MIILCNSYDRAIALLYLHVIKTNSFGILLDYCFIIIVIVISDYHYIMAFGAGLHLQPNDVGCPHHIGNRYLSCVH